MKRMFPNTHCKRETGTQFVPVIAGNTSGGTIHCTTMQQERLTRLSFQMYELCWCWFKAGLVKKASPYCSHFQGRSSAQILWWLITSCSLEKHFLHCVNNDTAFHLYDFSAIHYRICTKTLLTLRTIRAFNLHKFSGSYLHEIFWKALPTMNTFVGFFTCEYSGGKLDYIFC